MAKSAASKRAGNSGPNDVDEQQEADLVGITIRFPRDMHERLRKLSFDKRRPMSQLIIDRIADLLKAEKY